MVRISLSIKILSGYIILMAVIGCMAAILIHERQRMREIEADVSEIRKMRQCISVVQHHITKLAILGESVINWEEVDYRNYQVERLQTDSLLQAMKPCYINYVQLQQIDTLRILLADKEEHLRHIMLVFERQEEADSLLVNHLPEVAKRATRVCTIQQKKKGIASFLGGKKTVQVLPSAQELHEFSDNLITLQRKQAVEMDAYADSLRTRNRTLEHPIEPSCQRPRPTSANCFSEEGTENSGSAKHFCAIIHGYHIGSNHPAIPVLSHNSQGVKM